MGCLFFFDKLVPGRDSNNQPIKCNVEVVDSHAVPEVRLTCDNNESIGLIAEFKDWNHFVEFKDAIDSVYERLKLTHE